MTYFSEREEGERPREIAEIAEPAWGGIRALVVPESRTAHLARATAKLALMACSRGYGRSTFWLAMRGENPALQQHVLYDLSEGPPRTLDILDMIEFCWRCIGKPIRGGYHEHFKHYHLRFDVKAGRDDFCDAIIAYSEEMASHTNSPSKAGWSDLRRRCCERNFLQHISERVIRSSIACYRPHATNFLTPTKRRGVNRSRPCGMPGSG